MPPSVCPTPVARPTPAAVRATAAHPPRDKEASASTATAIVFLMVPLLIQDPYQPGAPCESERGISCLGLTCELRHRAATNAFVAVERRLDHALPIWVSAAGRPRKKGEASR